MKKYGRKQGKWKPNNIMAINLSVLMLLATSLIIRSNSITALKLPSGAGTLNCDMSSDACELQCSTFKNNNDLIELLENLDTVCKGNLSLRFRTSSYEIVNEDFLNGDFDLNTLIFEAAQMYPFANKSFDKRSMHSLEYLKIDSMKLGEFDEYTFQGLNSLKHFEYIDTTKATALKGRKFLQPFATTLETLQINYHANPYSVFDPTVWFECDQEFQNIKHIDLSHNRFPNILNPSTFRNLRNAKEFILSHCEIKSFDVNTFADMWATLNYLDLSNNELEKMAKSFVERLIANKQISIALHDNHWECSCDNYDFIKAIKNKKINFTAELRCFSPRSYAQLPFELVQLQCEDDEDDNTTAAAITTTPTTTDPKDDGNTTWPQDDNFLELMCQLSGSSAFLKKTIADASIHFELNSINATSLHVNIVQPFQVSNNDWQFLYYSHDDRRDVSEKDINALQMEIVGLKPETAYVLCAKPTKVDTIPPFNCQSHYMSIDEQTHGAWLYQSDKALCIGIFVLSIVLSTFLGTVILYLIARQRPTLIRECRRLIRLNTKTHEVVLADKKDEIFSNYSSIYADFLKSDEYQKQQHDKFKPLQAFEMYFRRSNLSPAYRAPAVPPVEDVAGDCVEEQSTTIVRRHLSVVPEICEDLDECVYQTIEPFP